LRCADYVSAHSIRMMTAETGASVEAGMVEAFATLQHEVAALGRKIEAMPARPGMRALSTMRLHSASFSANWRSWKRGFPVSRIIRHCTPDQHARAVKRAKEGCPRDHPPVAGRIRRDLAGSRMGVEERDCNHSITTDFRGILPTPFWCPNARGNCRNRAFPRVFSIQIFRRNGAPERIRTSDPQIRRGCV